MNVGFYIARMNYLGHFGPIINYFQKKEAEIVLLCDNRQKQKEHGYKAYLYPDLEEIQSIFSSVDIRAFHSTKEFVDIIKETRIQAVLFIAFDEISKEAKAFIQKEEGVIFAHLQPGGDIMYGKDVSSSDVVYIFSENWKTFWKKWVSHFKIIDEKEKDYIFEQIDAKTVTCGFAQADQLAGFDRRSILEKYDIPKDKKIILYLPFPWRVPFSIWSHIIYKPQNKIIKLARLFLHCAWQYLPQVFNSADDLQVAEAIRRFADRNNGFFLLKGRLKNRIPAYLKHIADKLVFDESYHPYTIMELMFVADLCIHFYSDAIKESVISNTPSICLGPTKREDWRCYAKRFFLKDFSPEPDSYYNFDGVVYNKSVDDFAANFGQKTFGDYSFDMENKERFIEKFLGFDDLRSSERIYNDLNNRLAGFKDMQTS